MVSVVGLGMTLTESGGVAKGKNKQADECWGDVIGRAVGSVRSGSF